MSGRPRSAVLARRYSRASTTTWRTSWSWLKSSGGAGRGSWISGSAGGINDEDIRPHYKNVQSRICRDSTEFATASSAHLQRTHEIRPFTEGRAHTQPGTQVDPLPAHAREISFDCWMYRARDADVFRWVQFRAEPRRGRRS